MPKIIIIDFAGTLIKPEIIEEANEFRTQILERATPKNEEHANAELLYKANRECVEKLTDIQAEDKIEYRTNTHQLITLTGEQLQNQIATNLFQIGMFATAKKHQQNIYPQNLIETLKEIKQRGYQLAIVSGVRTDIISGMLQITNQNDLIDYIFGQPPILGVSNNANMRQASQKGTITHIIGDKYSDLEPAKKLEADAIWVTWGHKSGNEEEIATYTINKPEELLELFETSH